MNKKIVLGMISIATVALLGACGNGNTKETSTNNNNQATSSSQVASSTTESSPSTTSTSSLLNQEFKVSLDDAIQLFSKEHPDVAITSIEFDTNFGAYGYKIEGVDDAKEYELFIDADTKEISKQKEERLDSEDANGAARKNDALLLDNIISPQKAMEAAFSEANKQGDVTEWKLSQEVQKTFYEVTIKNGSNETEVKIDSVSGDILQTEQDD
ncbi:MULTISPECIES: PepSY domain-containing protein [Carnobacterium]|uniref:PepSY domain-containing protein n=1 Tax=Carnobacterium TaxID=2747 RepID=UPI00026C8D21|nr:PepSY domain-containing protein [Carnobacterium maltaromaticum]MBC9788205.1 peptidase propeptide and YPEB domain-containing protein [Carnobacterium maltaromaticum]